ncbi:two component regulator with propeller domain [Flavobacterium tiangeerense]|uniref:Two component regulator with propeller domain n=1 Tax=Flavobacterium tiangeerense TaxID=459471 RepID=A0ABY3FKC5_9FLAO|nr:two-component regulator propeller domain-containing protein [Flavobacterium tiangeerense]TWH99662.1 two component regulator with propeller domain [Flavobacterium tiangeerense]
MIKSIKIVVLFLLFVSHVSCTQHQLQGKITKVNPSDLKATTTHGPVGITRNIIQDKKGMMWMASFRGVYKYDGTFFTNMTKSLTTSRFYSILEDSKGNLWFGTVGADASGVYRYDGKSFENFTTDQGLLNNEVSSIYEDNNGTFWFGVSGGFSFFDGSSFKNFIINENGIHEDKTGKIFAKRQSFKHTVNSILKDDKGVLWIATGDKTYQYNQEKTTVMTHDQKPFYNVRVLMKDSNGSIWLGGPQGLWRCQNNAFSNFSKTIVSSIVEDENGAIWIGSAKNGMTPKWDLSQLRSNVVRTEYFKGVTIPNLPMIFGLSASRDGNIWLATFESVFRYDGKTMKSFNKTK